MANGRKLPKLNKKSLLIILLILCGLFFVLLFLGVFTGPNEHGIGIHTSDLGTPVQQNIEPGSGLDQANPSQGFDPSVEEDATNSPDDDTTQKSVSVIPSEENGSTDPAFTPAALQKLRDPFQSLLKASPSASPDLTPQKEKTAPSEKSASGLTKPASSHPYPAEMQKPEQNAAEPKIPDQQSPLLVLKGVVSQGGEEKAIITSKNQSYIVSRGERVQEWLVEDIAQNQVWVVDEEGQRWIITFEGVKMDESSK